MMFAGAFFGDGDGDFTFRPAASTPPADPLDQLPTGPVASARRVINIFGQSGMGKTLLASSMYQGAIARGVSCTWIDSTGDNTYLARAGRSSGYRCAVVRTVDGWVAHIRAAIQEARRWNVILVPECDLTPLWSIAFELGHQLIAIDEAEQYMPATMRLEKHPLGKVLSQGRHRQLSMISTVRIPPELHGRAKAAADVTISFRQPYGTYADVIASECMHDVRPQLRAWLTRLPQWVYLQYESAGGRLAVGRTPNPSSLAITRAHA